MLWVADTFPWVEWRSRDKLQNITEEDVGLSHGEGGGGVRVRDESEVCGCVRVRWLYGVKHWCVRC